MYMYTVSYSMIASFLSFLQPASPFAQGGGISQGGGVTRNQLQQQQSGKSRKSNKPPLVFAGDPNNSNGDSTSSSAGSGSAGGPSAPTGAGRNRESGSGHGGPRVDGAEEDGGNGIFKHVSYHFYGKTEITFSL